MHTVLIRIGRLAGAAYPVEVFAGDAQDPGRLAGDAQDPGRLAGAAQDPGRLAGAALAGAMPASAVRAAAVSIGSDTATSAQLTAAGRAMFDALGVEGLAAMLDHAHESPYRIVVDVAAPELRRLPWELLRRPGGQLLFASRDRPAVRGRLPFPQTRSPLPSPVHVLVVVGDPGDGRLSAAEEVDAVFAGLCDLPACWQVDVLYAPTMTKLRRAFAEIAPHVLHFIGHGVDDDEPALSIVNPLEGPWRLTADFVLHALGDAPPPRLVVLNACRTAEGAQAAGRPPDQEAIWGVSEAFLAQGTAAVLAMQGDVASDAAVVFSRYMYDALVSGDPLDAAVARARLELRYTQGLHPRDWALPVLTVQSDPGDVLRVVRQVEPQEVLRRDPDVFGNVPWLVDRSDERRAMLRWLTPEGADSEGLLLVAGAEDVGKSWIAQACVLTGRLRGVPVAYVDLLRRSGNLGWVDFMQVLLDAVVGALGDDAKEPADRFADYLAAVVAQMYTGLPGQAPLGTVTEPVVPPQPGRPLNPDDYYRAVFDRFRSFAHEVTGGSPLLLVIDHIRRLQQHGEIVKWLVAPAARRELPQVRVAVVDRAEELDRILSNQVGAPHQLSVGRFNRDDIITLTREYCVRIRRRTSYAAACKNEETWQQFTGKILAWAADRAGGSEEVDPLELQLSEELNRRAMGLR